MKFENLSAALLTWCTSEMCAVVAHGSAAWEVCVKLCMSLCLSNYSLEMMTFPLSSRDLEKVRVVLVSAH